MHSDPMLMTMVIALAAGIAVIALAHRIHVSAIVLLLGAGFALGPSGLGLVQPESLGDGLSVLVSLAVGIILFEGGLTLDLQGYKSASGVIKRLLTWGVLTTWLGTAVCVWLGFQNKGFDVQLSVLAASLVIVTGPTVIAPLLKRIRVNSKLNSILHWEGVLIDPIGVFIALLCFEWIAPEEAHSEWASLWNFGVRIVAGLGIGVVGGFVIDRLIRWRIPPPDVTRAFTLGMAVLVFGIAEAVSSEAGLLAVTVAGFVLGVLAPAELKSLRQFKAEIVDMMIGMLFILLTARLKPSAFLDMGVSGWATVAAVMLIVRPLNVLVSTLGQDVSWRERLFLSWVAPRGIVAASMASLFALHLAEKTKGNPDYATAVPLIETFTYSVIAATVLIQGFTAGPLAWLLGVRRKERRGWMIVGAHRFGRSVAKYLRTEADCEVLLLDTNARAVSQAGKEGLPAVCRDARDPLLADDPRFASLGNLLALTDNSELNVLLCQHWTDEFGAGHVHRWGAWQNQADGTGKSAGRLVWEQLARPTLVSADIERGRVELEVPDPPEFESQDGVVPLVLLTEHAIVLPDGAELPAQDAILGALVLRREKRTLRALIEPGFVFLTSATTLHDALEPVVERVASREVGVDRKAILHALEAREGLAPTGVGHGVAIPHARVPDLSRRRCAIVRAEQPILVGDAPGEPVRLLFVLLSPTSDDDGHLRFLADIARLISTESSRHELLDAPDVEALAEAASRLLAPHAVALDTAEL